MKKWFVLFVACLLLIGCNNGESMMADSPEEALQKLSTDAEFVEIGNILNSAQLSDDKMFYVFEGSKEDKTEWFVAYLQKHKSESWFVVESFSIGLPNSDDLVNYSGGKLFRAAIHTSDESTEENDLNIPIPNSDYFVSIELTD